jgi:hypothetical protein
MLFGGKFRIADGAGARAADGAAPSRIFDGSGYPNALAKHPTGARIVTIADSFDTITSDRSYKKDTAEEALAEPECRAGMHRSSPRAHLRKATRQLPIP